MSESVEIIGPRSVRFVTVAVNRRKTVVSWDLWPNTRVRPEGSPYVRIAADRPPRIDGPTGGRAGTYPHLVVEGYLTLPPGARPKSPQEQLHVKVFIDPEEGEIAYFLGRQVLFLRAEPVSRERLHPEQAFVELYRGAGTTPDHDVLELEMHGPFVTLQPGEAMRFEQTAEIESYEGADDPAAHVTFLKKRAGPR